MFDLSDRFGAKAGSNFLMDLVFSVLPEAAAKGYKSARHFAVRDISG